ncbi:hypothetical protein NQ318_005832 [Aromia moschata]|uniref:THAP-type domain-containing protein n=1 Tax=Aromia moschata TaxID=1265417 RepID=A0AAV8YTN2_9CUCU|nr:hypothetical protein NQ318_005832 [Aromia moschata]
MVKLCCVQNCGSKSPDPDGNKRTLFTVPTDANRKDEWMAKIVPHLRKGKNRRKILYICDKHFKEDDIERDFTVILTNGLVCNVGPRQFYLGFSAQSRDMCRLHGTTESKLRVQDQVFKHRKGDRELPAAYTLYGGSVELQEIVSYLDDESKEASEIGQDKKIRPPTLKTSSPNGKILRMWKRKSSLTCGFRCGML